MRELPPDVLAKAVSIANAMLREDIDEDLAIRIGITRARKWAERGAHSRARHEIERSTDSAVPV